MWNVTLKCMRMQTIQMDMCSVFRSFISNFEITIQRPNEIYIPSKTIFNMLFDKCWWWKLEREIELKIIWRIFLFEICNFVNVIPFWLYFLPHRTYAYDINCIFIDSTIIFRPAKPKSLKYITLSIKHTYLRGMKITKKSQNM